MKKMYSVVQGRKRKDQPDKTYWQRHGIAFSSSKGISIKLESLPLPNSDGEVWLSLFEDDGKKGGSSGGSQGLSRNSFNQGPDDEIPF